MAVRWFFHQTDERRIKAHSLGSAAPLQKEEGLNSFGLAMILINNSIPHSQRERESGTDRQTWREGGRGSVCIVWRQLSVLEKCWKDWFIFNHTLKLHYNFSTSSLCQHSIPFLSVCLHFFYIYPNIFHFDEALYISTSNPLPLPELTLHCVVRCTVHNTSLGSLKL